MKREVTIHGAVVLRELLSRPVSPVSRFVKNIENFIFGDQSYTQLQGRF